MKQHVIHGDKFKRQWSKDWFYIHDKFSNGTYKLRNQHGQLLKKTFNGIQLKVYHERKTILEPEVVIEYVDPLSIPLS
jgi:hypothetical protein